MQVSVETTQGLERRMTVGVPAETVNSEISKRLQKLSKTQRIAGFRPGKVPLSVIRQRYGKPVRQEVLTEVMQRSFYEAVIQEKITPAGAPQVEPLNDEGEQFQFTAIFEVYPEVKVAELNELKLEKPVAVVEDEDVDNMLETLRKQRAQWEPVRRMAKKGDMAVIDFDGSIDGEVFAGGHGEGTSVVIGEGRMLEDFEKGLLKIKKDEQRDIEVVFPADYNVAELAGKTAVFHIHAHEVKGRILPELDEAFVKEFGIESGGLTALKAEVKSNMQRELAQTLRGKVKNSVLEQLAEANELDMPNALIDQEIERLRQQMSQQIGSKGDHLPELPASIFEDQANKRVKLGLLVSEIVSAHELSADPERVRTMVEEMASAYDEPQQVVDWYFADKQRLAEVESAVVEESVVEFILEQAKVKEKQHSFDEIMNPKA